MSKIWNMVNKLKVRKNVKNVMFIGILVLIGAIVGAAFWCLAGRFVLPGVLWLLCFIGYPAVFTGLFAGMVYLYNHEFQVVSRESEASRETVRPRCTLHMTNVPLETKTGKHSNAQEKRLCRAELSHNA